VGSLVPRGFPFSGFRLRELVANAEQQPTGLRGQPCGQIMVIHRQPRGILNILVAMTNFTLSSAKTGSSPPAKFHP
jgi:hypothetical protein